MKMSTKQPNNQPFFEALTIRLFYPLFSLDYHALQEIFQEGEVVANSRIRILN